MLENRALFLKQITLFAALAFIPFYIQWWVMDEMLLFYIGFLNMLPLALNIVLIRLNKLAAASLNMMLFASLNVYMYDEGFNGSTGFYFYTVSTILCGYIFFEKKEGLFRLFGNGLALLVLVLTNIPHASPRFYHLVEGVDLSKFHLPLINFIISSLLVFSIVYFMAGAYRKSESRLKKALQKAEEVADLKTQFLSNMSHELRTPMNAVVGLTDLLMRENPRPDQLENLNVLKFSSGNLLHIINDILDYSRIESGKVDFENKPFPLPELLYNMRSSMLQFAREKHVEVNIHIDSNIPTTISGDANRLTQVLNNLLNNAIKFTQDGRVDIHVKLLSFSEKHCKISFLVSDTGIGIPFDKQEQIFERFTQASSDTTRKYGGTGLGLAICARLLEIQNTRIHLQSRPGEGSEFSFDLEFELISDAIDLPQVPYYANQQLRNVRVLLAEDNTINQLVARKFLENWGVDLKVVNNGREALDHVRDHEVDLVLMDLQMPEMDGYEASRSIRELDGAHYQNLPIIALTASSMNEVSTRFTASGMNDFIHKPFNPDDLFRKMAAHLS